MRTRWRASPVARPRSRRRPPRRSGARRAPASIRSKVAVWGLPSAVVRHRRRLRTAGRQRCDAPEQPKAGRAGGRADSDGRRLQHQRRQWLIEPGDDAHADAPGSGGCSSATTPGSGGRSGPRSSWPAVRCRARPDRASDRLPRGRGRRFRRPDASLSPGPRAGRRGSPHRVDAGGELCQPARLAPRGRSVPVVRDPVGRERPRPGTKALARRSAWNGRVVWIPVTSTSSSARRSRSIAASRSAATTMIFAIIGCRTRAGPAPRPRPPCRRGRPGPRACCQRPMRPGVGANSRAGSSARGGPRSRGASAPRPARRQRPPPSDSGRPAAMRKLLADEVEVRHELGHAVLHLEARVHLEELERAIGIEQELRGRGVAQARRRGDPRPRARGRAGAVRGREPRRGRLLDQLLMAPLHRAVALAERDHLAGRVAEQLDLDMARRRDLALEVDRAVAERRGRLA